MSPFRRDPLCAGLLLGITWMAGCRADPARPAAVIPTESRDVAPDAASAHEPSPHEPPERPIVQPRVIQTAAIAAASRDAVPPASQARVDAAAPTVLVSSRLPPVPSEVTDDPFAGQTELASDVLVAVVLARNRSLVALQAAWRSAAARYPQAVALDDPQLMSLMAPGSFGDRNFQSSFMVGASQKVPWPGKRGLRGEAARAETAAASMDAGELAVRLEGAARTALVDYYLARRQLELVDQNLRQLQQLRTLAQNKYEARSATQQDVLQADVDLAELARRRLDLVQAEQVAVARINTLAHRIPDLPLPPPPRAFALPPQLPEAPLLYQTAVAQRPDLAALSARVRAEQVAVQLACREYLPDFDVGGRYDQFWDRVNQRGQLGINMNLPLYQERREAAVREARFRLSQRRAEYEQAVDDVRNDVQAAHARTDASRQALALYERRIVPAAQQNVEAARAGYEANNLGFLSVVEAQRQLVDAQMKRVEAVADYHRRLAELQQAVGGPLPRLLDAEEVPVPAR